MSPQDFSKAIGLVESNGNPNSPLGDGGRAFGRFQIHPDELWTWAKRLQIAPQLGETWDSFLERLVEAFYSFHFQLTPVECAMCWHLGHITHAGAPDWDAAYAAKFVAASGGMP